MNPSEILERAAEVLDERGWSRGKLECEDGSVCAYGALNVAYYGQAAPLLAALSCVQGSAFRAAIDALERADNPHIQEYGVADWNDEFAQSKEEVQDLLISVAKKFRNEGR